MAHGNNLACQQMCHVIQTVTMPVVVTVPIISGEQQPPLIFSLEKQGPHRKQRCGNQQWTNNNNTWGIRTTDKVEVSTITPPAPLLFHTRNRSHITISDIATHNGQQKRTNNHNDKRTWQWLQWRTTTWHINRCAMSSRRWWRQVLIQVSDSCPLTFVNMKARPCSDMSTNNGQTTTNDNEQCYNV